MKNLLYIAIFMAFCLRDTLAESDLNVASYNCSSTEQKSYPHPNNYTQYVECREGQGVLNHCPDCDIDPETCPGGKLCYIHELRTCGWYNDPKCGIARPTTTTTTPPPVIVEPPPKPGDPCPRNCSQCGYCFDLYRCQPVDGKWEWDSVTQWWTGEWVKNQCPGGLVWNPNSKDSGPDGSCDYFSNLNKDVQELYKRDEACYEPCYWEELENVSERCSGKYLYYNRVDDLDVTLPPPREMQCPSGLIFNEKLETCTLCKNLPAGETKNKCCPE